MSDINEPMSERKFDIFISQTLDKKAVVNTSEYTVIHDCLDVNGEPFQEFEINPYSVYTNEHLTPLELIIECKTLSEELRDITDSASRKAYYDYISKECDGWASTDLEIIKD